MIRFLSAWARFTLPTLQDARDDETYSDFHAFSNFTSPIRTATMIELHTLSDSEILAAVGPIMDNLMQGSTEIDHASPRRMR